MKNIIGIDLGTTNSEVALIKDGQPLVLNINGEPFMPSCVGLDDQGELLVGRAAKNQMALRPESTILSIKRLMGEETTVLMGGREFSAEEISALILRELKKTAEDFLNQEIEEVVITVPAYFDDHQRKATKNAGELAGLTVKRIINEPTAAALAYDVNQKNDQTILVYDLGGGTFDVSLVVIESGIVEVKASHGDTHLGGDDFDELLINHVADNFQSRYDIDLRANKRQKNRLWQAVEKAKIELSNQPFTTISEEFITDEQHLEIEIERHDYETMIQPLLNKTIDCINACLRDAALLPGALDQILLVGGSSRTPLIRTLLEETFNTPVHHEINPDLVVAMGAAIQGGIIGGLKSDAILVDITPYTFGTSAVGEYQGMPQRGKFVPIIKRNTPLPTKKSEVFYTMHDNQEEIEVKIFQGEDPLAENNIMVGNFMVDNLSRKPNGNPILLDLKLDLNGILEVTATEKISGLSKTVHMEAGNISQKFDFSSSREKLANIVNDQDYALPDKSEDLLPADDPETNLHKKSITRARDLRRRAEKLLSQVDEDDALEINDLLENSRKELSARDWHKLEQTCESLSDLLFYLED
ncbi:MAG: Hsp70 family protein [Deltaproteobacteria bacterium]|nr:Hsp70 family protein [Candidatus Tharpella sp.]